MGFVKLHLHIVVCLSITALLVCMAVSLCFGAVSISPYQVLSWLNGSADLQTTVILGQLRAPRILLGVSVGAILAVCGTATQGLFRNPMADPSLIGVSAGAAAGASLVIVLLNHVSWSFLGLSLVSFGAFLGGGAVAALVYRIATSSAGTSVSTMLLAGLAFTFLAGSLSGLFEFIADNEMLRRISLWRMGGLDNADYTRVIIVLVTFALSFALLYRQRFALNALLLGESEARHLGVDVAKVKKTVIISVAAGVGVAVATVGTIAFVGLIVPHIVRMVVGPNHNYMLPLTACVGAIVMVVADTAARTVLAPTEIPVGLLTSFIGAPIFIILLRRKQGYGV